ncbi:beta strand repeat-containing protein [Lactococcus nasutitermitis]|uniref:Beta strand repeat-containing protein n=1 Tax=Lactococcus nasutitermitis TaxID=1652957 RepID=A0ABV9JET9_9LACT|nr:flagellar hook-length control protein FliK [Lactococcus nasutitermitis]
MTLKSLNKKFAIASIGLLAAVSLGGAALNLSTVVNAADTQDQISNGTVIINAQQAAPNTAATTNNNGTDTDTGTGTTTPGASGGSAIGNQGTTKNDGTTQTVTGGTMANVTFTATSITPKTTASAMVPGDTSTYTAGSSTPVTTNANGVAEFDKLADGYYDFHQVTTVNGIATVADFIVQVNSEDSTAGTVNVYPKLDMSKSSGVTDTVTTNATSNDGSTNTPNSVVAPSVTDLNGDGTTQDENATFSTDNGLTAADGSANTTTAGAGDKVYFNVNSVFDSSMVNNGNGSNVYGTYTITDTLPSTVTAGTPTVSYTDTSGNYLGTLVSGADYNYDASTGAITLTSSGMDKLETAIAANGGSTGSNVGQVIINAQYSATVNGGTVGQVQDSATTAITNAYGAVLSTTTPIVTTVNVGGLDFTKTDGTNPITASGATFTLVKAASQADAIALVEANSASFTNTATFTPSKMTLGSASFVTGDTTGTADTTATTAITVTTSNGTAAFTGLNLVDNNVDQYNTDNYYAVEVKAPTGYQLPAATTGDNVFGQKNATINYGSSTGGQTALLADTTPTATDNEIANQKPFALPFTGGEGLAGIVIIASVAGLAAFAIRRRKNADEEVHEVK